jgi:hypothetical protein
MKSFAKTATPAKKTATKAAATPAKGKAAAKTPATPSKPAPKAKPAKEAPEKPEKALAVMPKQSIIPAGAESGDVSGEVDQSDIKLPYLNIVQGVGDLSENFTPGQIVLAGEVALTEPPKKEGKGAIIEMVIVWAKKQFIEKLPYGTDERARIFDTEAGVVEAGLHLDWIDNTPPPAGPLLTALILVKKPEDCEEESAYFSLEYGKDVYAPCMWRLQNTAYTRAAKTILTAKAMSRNAALASNRFQLATKREKVGQNWIFTPNLRAGGKYDADFVEFVKANTQ